MSLVKLADLRRDLKVINNRHAHIESKKGREQLIKKDIRDLSEKYGYKSKPDEYNDSNKFHRVMDATWYDEDNNPVIVIELDAYCRKKSIHKLMKVENCTRVWAYNGLRPKKAIRMLRVMGIGREINLINLSKKKQK